VQFSGSIEMMREPKMKKMTSAVATAALAVGAVAIAAGTATAAPVATTPVANHTHTLAVNPVVAPVVQHAAPVQAVRAQIKPATAPKTGALIGSAAVKNIDQPALKDIDWTSDFNSDLSVAATQFGLATGLGGMIGGVTGVVLGCPIGAATGGLLFIPEAAAGGLALVAGCLAGAGLLGTIGPVVGGALLGVPVGIASAVQMYNTMHAAHEIAAPMALPAHR
jgi:hypothetical protein